jgi:hypothetical protein
MLLFGSRLRLGTADPASKQLRKAPKPDKEDDDNDGFVDHVGDIVALKDSPNKVFDDEDGVNACPSIGSSTIC